RRLQQARLALDRDARIVRDLLPAAGEGVEQCGLAAVRGSDQREMPEILLRGDGDGRGHSVLSAVARIAIASRRRNAMVAWLTRTAIGSRANAPSCRISTCAPSTKPSSSRRFSISSAVSP